MAPALRGSLDRDIYAIVRKLEDEVETSTRLTVTSVYDSIKASNSSLARQKKRPLEDSIERVLSIRQREQEEDEMDSDNSGKTPASSGRSATKSPGPKKPKVTQLDPSCALRSGG